jgi:nucleoporin NUP82
MIHLLTATGDVYLLGPILPLRAEVPSEWLRNLSAYAAGEDSTTRRWVGKLQQHAKEGQSGLMSASNSELENGVSRTNNGVRLFPPHLTPSGGPAPGKHSPICRQGPVTFSPAPKVTYGPLGEEDVASDMVIILTEAGEAVMGIAWAGGRVDVGMLIDMPTPKWVDGRVSQRPRA